MKSSLIAPARSGSLAILGFVAIAGAAAIWSATRLGVGVTPDSVAYVYAARTLLAGEGLQTISHDMTATPLILFPPLYPAVLGTIGLAGIDALDGARLLNLLLFPSNLLLVGSVLLKASYETYWIKITGLFLALSSVTMLALHSLAMSEPLFLFLTFLGLLVLSEYLSTGSTISLLLATLALGLAGITRYTGIPAVVCGALGIAMFGPGRRRRRHAIAILFLAIASSPLLLWLIRNLVVAGTATARHVELRPVTAYHLKQISYTLATWLMPDNFNPLVRFALWLVAFTALATTIVIAIRNSEYLGTASLRSALSSVPKFQRLLLLYAPLYFAFLLGSIVFLDAIPADYRTLSPLFLVGIFLFVWIAQTGWGYMKEVPRFKLAFSTAILASAISYGLAGGIWLIRSSSNGPGYYTSVAWRDSETLAQVRQLPVDTRIYSNGPDLIYIRTGRTALLLPSRQSGETAVFDSQMAEMANQLVGGKAVIVFFNRIDRWYLPEADELRAAIRLQPSGQTNDGTIFVYDEWS